MSGQTSSGNSPAGPAGTPDAGNLPAGSAGQGAGDAGGTGAQGGGAANWLASLPEAFQKDPNIQKFKGPDALAASYIELSKSLGNSVRMPSKPEEWDGFFAKAGRPETPDKYQFTKPDIGIDGHTFDLPEGFEAEVRARAHAAGMNQVQFDRYLKAEIEDFRHAISEAREAGRSAEEKVREMWGASMDRNLALSHRALQFYDPDGELAKVLEDTGLGNHPKIIKLFYDMSQRLSEDGLIPGEVQGVYAPEAALAKIAELRQNPAYSNAGHPEHDRVVAEIEKYYQIAYSGR